MASGQFSITRTEERERLYRGAESATGESTTSGALDVAARHARSSRRELEELAQELEEELGEEVSRYAPGVWSLEVSVDVVGPGVE